MGDISYTQGNYLFPYFKINAGLKPHSFQEICVIEIIFPLYITF